MPRFASRVVRFIPVFLMTLVIGLWADGLFADYRIRFYIEKDDSFSAEEVEPLIGKKVLIQYPGKKPQKLTIVGVYYGQVELCCTVIERNENGRTIFQRDSFNKYVTVVDE